MNPPPIDPQPAAFGPASEAAAALAQVPLLAALPPPVRSAMAEAAQVRSLAPGAVIATFGAPAREVFLVLEGHVRLMATAEDGAADASPNTSIDIQGPGTVIGLGAVTGVGSHPLGASAVDAVRGVAIDGARVRDLLAQDMALVLRLLGSVSGSLRGLVAQVNDLKQRTTAQRLGMFLLELAGGHGRERLTVRLPFGKKVVAEKLGMSPESLSRALAALAPLGVRQEAGGAVVIEDAADLADHCGYSPDDPTAEGASP